WRLYAFADPVRPSEPGSRLAELCDFLSNSPESPVVRYTPANADPDALFDVRAVVQQNHHELAPTELPNILLPTKGPFGLLDYEIVFCSFSIGAQKTISSCSRLKGRSDYLIMK